MGLRYSPMRDVLTTMRLLSLIFLAASCKKFVEIPPPSTRVTTGSVFSNSVTVNSALFSIYYQMYNNGESYRMAHNHGLMADELTNYSTIQSNVECYQNNLLSVTDNGEWDNGYKYIYQANALIEGLRNNGNIPDVIVQQITGEAKFIRAFWHFYLVNDYGSIPLVTTTDYRVTGTISRSLPTLVYNQIIADLKDAIVLLNSNYVDATDTTNTQDRIRPNKSAAEALLARVYLYAGYYDSAKMEASLVINNTALYKLDAKLSGTNSVFRMNSTEAIWQLGIPSPQLTSNTVDALNFTLAQKPSTGNAASSTISPQLLSAFEPNDQRMTSWIGVYKTTTFNYYFPYKYQSYNTKTISEYTMVLRLAEQFLIRAEAEANVGDMMDAAADLNIIRARAGLSASTTLTATSSLVQADSAILHERQVELFTEWGHRWFDLKRMGAVNQLMGAPGNVCQLKGGKWTPNWQLFPIPQYDMTNDPNLNQNPGYN